MPGKWGSVAIKVAGFDENEEVHKVALLVWDPNTLSWVKQTADAPKTLKTAAFSLSATGSVVSAVTSKRIKVFAIKLSASAAISVKWRDGASTDLEGFQPLAANGGYVETVQPNAFLLATSAGNSLDLVISGTGTASGRVSYWDDDAT
jgi:hypothetical protein